MSDSDNMIPFSNAFQKIAEIVIIVQSKIDLKTDVVWTGFNTPYELKRYLTDYSEKLQLGDYDALSRVYNMFGPTGTFQELSISNGWGDEYIELAKQFDCYHEKIRIG
jgi:hypothetical protein